MKELVMRYRSNHKIHKLEDNMWKKSVCLVIIFIPIFVRYGN